MPTLTLKRMRKFKDILICGEEWLNLKSGEEDHPIHTWNFETSGFQVHLVSTADNPLKINPRVAILTTGGMSKGIEIPYQEFKLIFDTIEEIRRDG